VNYESPFEAFKILLVVGIVGSLFGFWAFSLHLFIVLPVCLLLAYPYAQSNKLTPASYWVFIAATGVSFLIVPDGFLFGVGVIVASRVYLTHHKIQKLEKYIGSHVAEEVADRVAA